MRTTMYWLSRCFNPKRFLLPHGVANVALLSIFAAVVWALTVPSTIFEVGDGDTAPNGSANCDWNTLNGAKTADSNTPAGTCVGDSGTGPNAYVFLVGDTNEKNFTTGGSKDSKDPQDSWQWSSGSTPDKDTLTHGYAASYTGPDGHKVLVYGAERLAVNGDANIGVWFFQSSVKPVGVGKNGFTGHHQDGDVFAVSAFTNGGGHPGLDVYIWDAAAAAPGAGCPNSHYSQPVTVGDCADTNLRLIFHAASGDTSLCSGTSAACTSVNGSEITPSWPYASKFGGSGPVPINGFFEGGFDLTALFPGGAPGCFSSFLVETRSSQSTDAVLKDFLSGNFPECSFTISKACQCTAVDGNTGTFTYTYGGTVTNTGGAPLFNVTITDSIPGGSIQTYTCATLGQNATLSWPSADCTPSSPNTFTSTNKGLTNSASATAQTSPGAGTINAINNPANALCLNDQTNTPVCVPAPGIAVTKTCSTSLVLSNSQVAVQVNYLGRVTNQNGSEALDLVFVNDTNNTASDGTGGTPDPNNPLSLQPLDSSGNPIGLPCNSCTLLIGQSASFSGSYIPSNGVFLNPDGSPIAGRAIFYDRVVATGTGHVSRTVVSDNHMAHCVVCPFGTCEPQ